jgi:hypothetical protein
VTIPQQPAHEPDPNNLTLLSTTLPIPDACLPFFATAEGSALPVSAPLDHRSTARPRLPHGSGCIVLVSCDRSTANLLGVFTPWFAPHA